MKAELINKLDEVFHDNCKNLAVAYPIFKDMLAELSVLPIVDGYADYGNQSDNIHFNLFFNDDYEIVIDRYVYDENDIVFYSIVECKNGNRNICIMEEVPFSELITSMKIVMKEVLDESCPECAADVYYVYGFWNIYPDHPYVHKDGKEDIREFSSYNDAEKFIASQIDSNVNIVWCITKTNPKNFR